MTDTGQVPAEGQPESAGMVEQPGLGHGAYTYLAEAPAEDEDLLLPGAQGAWGNELPPPAPAPIVEAVHQPDAHETAGRDTGSVDLGGVRLPEQGPGPAQPPRRPLHLGPPIPDASASPVRSLADRGPAGAPVRPSAGPEYLDVQALPDPVPQAAAPWGAGPVEGVAPAAETVVPEVVLEQGALELGVPELGVPEAVAPEQVVPEPLVPAQVAPEAVAPETVLPEAVAPDEAAPEAAVADEAAPQEVVPEAALPEAVLPVAESAPAEPVEPAEAAQAAVDRLTAQAEAVVEEAPQAPLVVEIPEPEVAGPVLEAVPDAAPGHEAEAAIEEALVEVAEASAEMAPEAVAAPAAEDPQAVGPEVPAAPVQEVVESPVPEPAPEPEAPLSAEEFQLPGHVAVPQPPAFEPPAPVDAHEALSGPQLQAPGEAPAPAEPLPTGLPPEPHPEPPLGRFVAVDGQVPTTPHLAPTPPRPLILPDLDAVAEQSPVAEAPEPDLVQHAEDLATTDADQGEDPEPALPPGPAAPAYNDAEREAVLKVIRERRDIRNGFRSDPIPHDVLLRVLEAAHTAPSVGHSQPWDFVVIRSADTRRAMHDLAMSQREAYAKSLPKGRAKQFKEMKIEAILDTPVNIVVTADPTRGGRHTLGRHTQPQMAPYSSALAVENLWLAARAEGLGVGWVSFFDEREMVRALGLPEHLEVVAYLCVGYVDEFPDEPELMQAGWSKRRPLSWVVHEETYGRRALPGEDPHDLLAETVAQIRPLDAKALGEAWERQKRMTKPAGALGMLEIISAQLSGLSRQCPPPIPEPAAVAVFAGDHGVHAQGVTPWPQEVTGQMVANFLGGGAVCNAFANQVGAEVCVVDVGVVADLPATPGLLPRKIRGGTSDMTTGPAMTREEARAAIEVGIETARDLVAAGNKALLTGEMGIGNTTSSAALISVFTGADPAEVTGRGTGINDETLARKTEVVRRALELHQPDPADPIGVLAALGGFEHAAMVGLLLGGASLRTPVILDGVSAGAAALVARAIAPEVLAACIAGHRSAEPGHVAALNKLGLRPLVDLDLRLGEGTGALLALPLVQSTARAMHEVATFDSAGVTEK
ncbi:nicotinate-nucleotide-dimethylbenzimidazole phosphoribosyltransferase /cob(II)yrinic acid a,c-diamide reductase [Streptomyces sp. BK022]|uniref:nicotinate-nucleotide--dimethylbenzimidazole phosphoribosyltransferase n=1 Tax=Streptomyces sp. BK022 TaxID=2512123 RepID=UPI001028E546|nr:nicotinate-nucleotide--dimethylbenzimidazole phosphoribosyltransferase [Streptomyces sp. BK022]RZU28725.1 nicotinate-nucleotide-dimethylbenzimidazole phosphoribosyltransferase /cob(II)yrinic acid a,c-diamide reductase [Streptomyces sp. BK022]